jgi:uncharacterized protein YndB with AHSA1/START domain
VTARESGLELRIARVLHAPRADVFRALTDPDELAKWWGPQGFTAPYVDFDPRVGESYRIAMQPPVGELFYLTGEFREVDPPARIVYTFRWEDPTPDDRETVVTLSLRERGADATELDLAQEAFTTEERYALHQGGWSTSLDKLDELVSRSGLS